MCNFEISWSGKCKEESVENGYCEKHKKVVCFSCGKQATKDCGETMMGLVCGSIICNDLKCQFKHRLLHHTGNMAHIIHDAVALSLDKPLIVVSKRTHTGVLQFLNDDDNSYYISILLKVNEEGKEQYKVYRNTRKISEEESMIQEGLKKVYGVVYTDVYFYDGLMEDRGYLPLEFKDKLKLIRKQESQLIEDYIKEAKQNV